MFTDRLKLPFKFDVVSLQKDLVQLQKSEWISHFVTNNYEGDWSVIPLRGPKNATHPIMMIYSDPSCTTFADTIFLEPCTYFKDVLAIFQCELEAVRLMKLAAGSRINEHQDYDLAYESGNVRLHIPIETNQDVRFFLNGSQIKMIGGDCWYLRLSDPHSVENNSKVDRIHMVIDAKVNNWLHDIFTCAEQLNLINDKNLKIE